MLDAIIRATLVGDLQTVGKFERKQGHMLLSEDLGQAAMVVVVFIGLFLLGFVALGLDVGYLVRPLPTPPRWLRLKKPIQETHVLDIANR